MHKHHDVNKSDVDKHKNRYIDLYMYKTYHTDRQTFEETDTAD